MLATQRNVLADRSHELNVATPLFTDSGADLYQLKATKPGQFRRTDPVGLKPTTSV